MKSVAVTWNVAQRAAHKRFPFNLISAALRPFGLNVAVFSGRDGFSISLVRRGDK